MTFHLEIMNDTTPLPRGISKLFCQLGEAVLRYHQLEGRIDVTLIICTNHTIRQLNRDFRHIDKVTDVLSFPNYEHLNAVQQDTERPLYLGDIAIAFDKVRTQAMTYGHSFRREICFLFVHGLLHILGYDHHSPDQEREMFELQEKILTEFGIGR